MNIEEELKNAKPGDMIHGAIDKRGRLRPEVQEYIDKQQDIRDSNSHASDKE
jgi:hypothetical protein